VPNNRILTAGSLVGGLNPLKVCVPGKYELPRDGTAEVYFISKLNFLIISFVAFTTFSPKASQKPRQRILNKTNFDNDIDFIDPQCNVDLGVGSGNHNRMLSYENSHINGP
jgi:hypothetical protein